ncbi:MAG: hypothetical protein M1433_00760, partial [Candidatus Parvarchaeota archaeon]|nr:hypothetical protein [Candidatus Parvarchaeota archaeon]
AEAIQSVCNSLSGDNITILSILSKLELGPLFSIRRTFSRDSMLKAYLLLKLKKIRSYRALVNYLRNRPEEALSLGFDKESDGSVRIPTHQNISHFVMSLSKDDIELVENVINTINELAEKFNIVIDTKPVKSDLKDNASDKTISAHRSKKSEELISFVKSRLKKKLKFKLRHNAIFQSEDLLNTLIWIAYEQNFAESMPSGTVIFSELLKRRSPSADALFYHIKKFGIGELREIFFEIFEIMFRTAKQMRLLGTRKVDVAIDATSWLFYGDTENYGVVGTKPPKLLYEKLTL